MLQNPYYEYWEEAEELSEEETDETYKADCEKYRATLKGTIQKVGTKLHCREAIYDPPEDFSGERKKVNFPCRIKIFSSFTFQCQNQLMGPSHTAL